MLRVPAFGLVLVLVSAGCDHPAPAIVIDSGSDSAPSASSAAPSPSSVGDAGLGFGFGSSSSGPGHWTMNVDSRDGPRAANLGPLYRALAECYKRSPHRNANEALRVVLQITVSATGDVTTMSTVTIKSAPADKPITTCVDDAIKSAAVTVPDSARGTSFKVTVDLSP